MEDRKEFQRRVRAALDEIGPETLEWDESEFWMVQAPYEYIEFYAVENRLWNTAIALPLSRGLHNGVHRKSSITRNGQSYRLPYLIHPLMVCRMLVDLHIPLSREEEDIMLAASLCHDMIEDLDFRYHGTELYNKYHLDPRVYEIVKKLSKRKDFTDEEEQAFFRHIQEDPLALLIKLSDRGNNVEDLYNMSSWKVHEYVGETRRLFFPMYDYASSCYKELRPTLDVLQDKIVTLTKCAEVLVDRCDAREAELVQQVQDLQEENERLRARWQKLWKE